MWRLSQVSVLCLGVWQDVLWPGRRKVCLSVTRGRSEPYAPSRRPSLVRIMAAAILVGRTGGKISRSSGSGYRALVPSPPELRRAPRVVARAKAQNQNQFFHFQVPHWFYLCSDATTLREASHWFRCEISVEGSAPSPRPHR